MISSVKRQPHFCPSFLQAAGGGYRPGSVITATLKGWDKERPGLQGCEAGGRRGQQSPRQATRSVRHLCSQPRRVRERL